MKNTYFSKNNTNNVKQRNERYHGNSPVSSRCCFTSRGVTQKIETKDQSDGYFGTVIYIWVASLLGKVLIGKGLGVTKTDKKIV